MWMTISMIAMAVVVAIMADNQIITNRTVKKLHSQCRELEKRVADLEYLTQPIDGTWQSMYQVLQSIKQALSLYVKEGI